MTGKAHCMDIGVGDIVLVRQKVFGTTYKIEDKWEVPVLHSSGEAQ